MKFKDISCQSTKNLSWGLFIGIAMQKIDEVKDYLLSQNREFQTEVHLFIQKCAFDTPFS